MESRNREKSAQVCANEHKKPFVLSKFSNVPSLVYSRSQFPEPEKRHSFLKAGEGVNIASRPLSRGCNNLVGVTPSKVSSIATDIDIPDNDYFVTHRGRPVSSSNNRNNINSNYIRENALAVIKAKPLLPVRPPPREPFAPSSVKNLDYLSNAPSVANSSRHAEFGKIPVYLQNQKHPHEQRNDHLNHIQQTRQNVNNLCDNRNLFSPPDRYSPTTLTSTPCNNLKPFVLPEGFRELTESERIEALEGLKTTQREVEAEFARLPLRVETESQRKWLEALELDLKDVREAILIFSQPRVAVPIEESDEESCSEDESKSTAAVATSIQQGRGSRNQGVTSIRSLENDSKYNQVIDHSLRPPAGIPSTQSNQQGSKCWVRIA